MKRRGGLGGRTIALALGLMALTAAVPMIVIALLVSGGGEDTPAPGSADVRAVQGATDFPLYWAGESVAGLPLTSVTRDGPRVNVQYGDCRPSGDEGGCALSVTIQSTSICARNPLILDLRQRASRRVRGVIAHDYGDGTLSLEVGTSNVTIFTRPAYRDRVLAALRAAPAQPAGAGGGGLAGADLPPARYPLAYVLELRLVRDTYRRFGSVRAVRDKLGISQSAVRQRLAFARELGVERLHRPAAQFVRESGCPLEPAG